ncbi:S-layer homology domain-containing protein [Sporosarcina newyorkensis]|uniref:S-layer homology domain-containing protein n=2 Tax=Sporosarcina newyorkensis TaxID=759851 RepID=A0A1T4XYH2_9BACL|nr:S-layer homology domain-containing protein [Sporosarcina newyorkensis]EGQ26843.1 hypothetical protein HMPREF9372_1180 [Sporosarcina newyorkensis 2681]SKA94590.1 S-layer homology domain-containing protein [Sporosarcina newyorkensis]
MSKRYQRFTALAASAALTIPILAPITASAEGFSDIKGSSHESSINALVQKGIISGYADGTYKPNKTLTRSDVVKLMGKWLVSLGFKIPADYQTKRRFSDLTSSSNEELLKYAALVKDHGVFNGQADGKLNPTGDITRENMAIVLIRAYDAIHSTDLLIYVESQPFIKDVGDQELAKSEARPFIDVLDFFDITNPAVSVFNPKNTTTRGQFASFLYKVSTVPVPVQKSGAQQPPVQTPKWNYNGMKTIRLDHGADFTFPEVKAIDDSGKSFAVQFVIKDAAGNTQTVIDTTKSGMYTIKYSVINVAGEKVPDLVIAVWVAPPTSVVDDVGLEIISIT